MEVIRRDYGLHRLERGWSDFVSTHGFPIGTVMVFYYQGGVHFDVRVLDPKSVGVENGHVNFSSGDT